jgi:polygalacturonase
MSAADGGFVIGNFDKIAELLALVVVLGPICVPLEALARTAAPSGCTKSPASGLTVNVRDKGAKGDGRTNDAAAIQRAVDEVAGRGGTVLIPDGTYLVDTIGPNRIMLKSGMALQLAPGAVLKAIPNGETQYAVLTIEGASNVRISGGTLEGDRDQHLGKTGEWGHGIHMVTGEHITVTDIKVNNMWGDGIFMQAVKNVALCGIIADRNRRQGISVIEVEGLLVTNSVLKNTHGTRPSAGIDLEPDSATQHILNVRISNSKFLDNAGAGVLVLGRKGANNIRNVVITGNLFRGAMPVKVKYAPGVLDSDICHNRYKIRPEQPRDLATVGTLPEEITVMASCGDPGLRTRQ